MRYSTIGVILLFLGLMPLQAGVILGNLPGTDYLGSQIGNSPAANYVKGVSFTMGGTDYSLASVELRLDCWVGGIYPSSTCSDVKSIQLGLYSDSTGAPGALLTSFNYSFSLPLATTSSTYTFNPASSVQLNHGATYWLTLGAVLSPVEDQNAIMWMRSEPVVAPTGAGATYAYGLYSTDGGASWGSSVYTPSFEIDGSPSQGSATPEPATAVLVCCGLTLAVLLRRRR